MVTVESDFKVEMVAGAVAGSTDIADDISGRHIVIYHIAVSYTHLDVYKRQELR